MKRSTPEHPKMARLAKLLHIEKWGAVGIMESLWHFAAKHSIQGDIGKWEDDEISIGIGWAGDATQLVAALIDAGWLDRCKVHRLLIHDWAEHADESVKKTIANRGIDFHRAEPFSKIRENSRRVGTSKGSGSGSGSGKAKRESEGEKTDEPNSFDRFYSAYPKKVAPAKAQEEFAKAVKKLKGELRFQEVDPVEFLIAKATEFAPTLKGQAGKYCPNPSTWLHQGRYDDDPATWNEKESGNGTVGKQLPIGPGQKYDPATAGAERRF